MSDNSDQWDREQLQWKRERFERLMQVSIREIAPTLPELWRDFDQAERFYILNALERNGGNKRKTAKVLGVDRRTLYRKLERWARERP